MSHEHTIRCNWDEPNLYLDQPIKKDDASQGRIQDLKLGGGRWRHNGLSWIEKQEDFKNIFQILL